MTWKTFLNSKKNRVEIIITVVILAATMLSFSQFLQFIEQREGVAFQDPLLNTFNPINLTWLIFALIYLSIILFLITFLKKPYKLMVALQAYGLMVIIRIIAMYLTPFEAPEKLILLNDPFVQLFGQGAVLTKDLFFSGHTATLFLLFLLAENKALKITFLIFTIIVGTAVLLQHVHYSIDVFMAPFVAYSALKLVLYFHNKNIGAVQ